MDVSRSVEVGVSFLGACAISILIAPRPNVQCGSNAYALRSLAFIGELIHVFGGRCVRAILTCR
jgi:hypothetical protein